jgi:hypothetical protein
LSVITVMLDVQLDLNQRLTFTCRSSKYFMKQNTTVERFINFHAWCAVVTVQWKESCGLDLGCEAVF